MHSSVGLVETLCEGERVLRLHYLTLLILILVLLICFNLRRFGAWSAHSRASNLLLVLHALVDLLQYLMLDLAGEAELLRGFADCTWGQVKVNLVNNLAQVSFHVGKDYSLREALPIGLVPTIVLDFDMEVQGALASINLLTVLVGANVLSIDLFCRPSVVLLSRATLDIDIRVLH